MPKKKTDLLLCTGCGYDAPEEDIAESGWFVVIRAWKGGTKTFVYCPSCYAFHYGMPIQKTEDQPGSTMH